MYVQFGSSYSCFAGTAETNLAERRLRFAHGGEGPDRTPRTEDRAVVGGQVAAVRARRGAGEVHEKGSFSGENAGRPSSRRRGAPSCLGVVGIAQLAPPQPATGPTIPACPASSADLGLFCCRRLA